MTISERIKRAIIESPESQRAIGLKAGVSLSHICRVLSGERPLTLTNAERLAEYFGLSLTTTTQPKRKK